MGCGSGRLTDTDVPERCKQTFDFKQNQRIEVQRVIQATYLNPRRKIHPQKIATQELHKSNDSSEWFIKKLTSEMPRSLEKANSSNTMLHDIKKLNPGTKTEVWLKRVVECQWYGPYVDKANQESFYFYAGSPTGDFEGIFLWL